MKVLAYLANIVALLAVAYGLFFQDMENEGYLLLLAMALYPALNLFVLARDDDAPWRRNAGSAGKKNELPERASKFLGEPTWASRSDAMWCNFHAGLTFELRRDRR